MGKGLSRLIKFSHYRGFKGLRLISVIQLITSLCLIPFPLYFPQLLHFIVSIFQSNPDKIPDIYITTLRYMVAYPIAILSGLNLLREFMLSRTQVISFDIKRAQIRQLVNYLMDNYEWKGTCRTTIFMPSVKKDKIIIYDRISAGKGIGHFDEGKCYFTMGQGVPGRAWENAWSGEDDRSLINSFQFANVPELLLKDKTELRNFFKEKCGITDDKIYDSMGSKKQSIKSYIGIGILGRYQDLICVIVIDSEESNKFTDFEQLQKVQSGRLTRETGLAIISNGESLDDNFPIPLPTQLPPEIMDLLSQSIKKLKDAEPEETKDVVRSVGFFAHMARSTINPGIQAPAFLYPLKWVLKQIKEIIISDQY